MSEEINRIEVAYQKRQKLQEQIDNNAELYAKKIIAEREKVYLSALRKRFQSFNEIKLLEIGAGVGTNLDYFIGLGFKQENIYANELLPDRYDGLVNRHPDIKHLFGNAAEMDLEENSMDVIFQSTVFTSITDNVLKNQIAKKIFRILKSDGIILWYDFTFNNPKNNQVKGIKISEITSLFPEAKITFLKKVTLAPPIGRRLPKWYKYLNAFPFLRTHIVAVIEKS